MSKLLAATPALPAAIGLAAGITVQYHGMPLWAVAALGATAIALVLWHRVRTAFYLAFIILGWTAAYISRPAIIDQCLTGKEITIAGKVVNVNHNAPGETNIDIQSRETLGNAKCRLRLRGDSRKYCVGDCLIVQTRLKSVITRNSTNDFHENDYGNSAYFAYGVSAEGYAGTDDITITRGSTALNTAFARSREYIHDMIMLCGVDNATAWLMEAVILGDDSGLSPQTVEQMRSVGVAHYLALSGFHVGIIAVIVSYLLIFFKTWSHIGRLRHLIVIAVVWLYAMLCGMTPSLLRASIFISIALLAKVLQRQSTPLNSLCVAAALSLAINPYWLFTPGFQLSFAAVAAIVTMAEPLNPLQKCTSRLLCRLGLFVSVPVAATIGTALITACHFHRIPLMFLPADIALAVFMPLFIAVSLIVIVCTASSMQCPAGAKALDAINGCLDRICGSISEFHFAEIRGLDPSWHTVIIVACSIVCFVIALRVKRRHMLLASLALACIGLATGSLGARPAATAIKYCGNGRNCELLVANGRHCIAICDDNSIDSCDYAAYIRHRFSQYLDRRNASFGQNSVHTFSGDFTLPGIWRRNNLLTVGDTTVYTLFDHAESAIVDKRRIHYLFVGRKGAADATTLIRALRPETVVIANNVGASSRANIVNECAELGVKAIMLEFLE